MLNRIYIVVGILAILAVAAAFVVPRFIQWGDYRDRMEAMASEALGTPVKIQGDIHFNLLPAPQLEFADVMVGPAAKPVLSVGHVRAEFSLLDFLRDRYAVTKLVLQQPALNLAFDEGGFFQTGINLPAAVDNSNVAIGNATIEDGTLTVADARVGDSVAVQGIDGDLKLEALRGPFTFQGRGSMDGRNYGFHLSTSTMGADGSTRLAAFIAPDDNAYSANLEGTLTTGVAPRFDGDLTYRQTPPASDSAGGVRGDLVLTGKLQAMAEQILMPNYTLVPDENRAGTRLTGAAVVHLGAVRDFDAVVSGGVAALPPRDATKEEGTQPYELVRLLGELPAPPIPPLSGTLGVDLSELNLRGIMLRDLRVDASSDGKDWTLKTVMARLPGGTAVNVSGTLAAVEGRPEFSGSLDMRTSRLDALAQLWRKPSDDNPLFNMPAALSGRLSLSGDDLKLSDGTFMLDNIGHKVDGDIGFGPERQLDMTAQFAALDAFDAEALAALLPEGDADGAFAVTFPQGHMALSAQSADVFGFVGKGVAAEGSWNGQGVTLSKFAAEDYGGVKFDLKGHLAGTLAEPKVSAGGSIAAASAAAPALAKLYDIANTPQQVRDYLARSLPADLKVTLEEPGSRGSQVLTATGKVGVADLGLSVQMGEGIGKALESNLSVTAELAAASGADLTAQLGLGDVSLFPEGGPVRLKTIVQGSAATGFATSITAAGSGDSLDFEGNVKAGETLSGKGDLKLKLAEASALAGLFGADGLYLPGIEGSSKLTFDGSRSVTLNGIAGTSQGQAFSGDLSLTREGGVGTVAGSLKLGALNAAALTTVLGGPAALLPGSGSFWPDGPISVGDAAKTTRGAVSVTTPSVDVAGRMVSDAAFTLGWDENGVKLRDLTGSIGGGTLAMDLGVCCSGTTPQKQANGRISIDKVSLAALLPDAPAANVAGTVSGSAQFNGTGASIAEIMGSLAGEGSYQVDNLSIARLDPEVFKTVAGLDNVVDMDADALQSIVAMALDRGPFAVPQLSGAFTIAGGTVGLQNLSAEAEDVRFFGGTSLHLANLGLDGSFSLTPTEQVDSAGLITPTTSQVTAVLSGSLTAPERTLDLGTMTDTIKMKAYENELSRLEQLQKEDEARQKAAAEERAKLMAEQKRIADEAAAKKAAEEAAAKEAAEAAQQQQLQQQQQQSPNVTPAPQAPARNFDLTLPPPSVTSPSFTVLQ